MGADDTHTGGGGGTGSALDERTRITPRTPACFHVVLLNDDYTPMGFVVDILESLFHRSPVEAYAVMMEVHLDGRGIAGTFPWDVAETKVEHLLARSEAEGHPLRAVIEPA